MSEKAIVDPQQATLNHSLAKTTRNKAANNPGWVLALGAVTALVCAPAVLADDQSTGIFTIVITEEDVQGAFAATPAVEVTNEEPPIGVALRVLVGHNPGTTNTYQLQTSDEVVGWFDKTGNLRITDPSSANITTFPDIPETNGYCCGSEKGFAEDDFVEMVATSSDTITRLVSVPVDPPNTPTTGPMTSGGHISSSFDYLANLFLGSSYNTGANQVDFYTRPAGGSWTWLTWTPCDGPYSGDHWGVTAAGNSPYFYTIYRQDGQVSVTQIDASTGITGWTHPLDTVPYPPSNFHYYQCCNTGPTLLPDKSIREALACTAPADDGLTICEFGPVDQPATPPSFSACVTFPGAYPGDRQAFTCDGSMIYYHGADPDGTGVVTTVINCGHLDGECTWFSQEENTRNVRFASFLPKQALVNGSPVKIIEDRKIIIEGDTDLIRYIAMDLPMMFDNFETGTTNIWDRVVGGG